MIFIEGFYFREDAMDVREPSRDVHEDKKDDDEDHEDSDEDEIVCAQRKRRDGRHCTDWRKHPPLYRKFHEDGPSF